jgi:hypothetical protein
MSEHDHTRSWMRMSLPPCETLRAAFERHDTKLNDKQQQLADELLKMQAEWGESDSVERYEMVQSFLEQLRTDPLYESETDPETSEIWLTFERAMDDVEDTAEEYMMRW